MNHHHTLMLGVALLLGSSCASSLHAQTDPSPTLSLIGGVSSTTLVGKDAADNLNRRQGVLAGLSVVYSLTSMVQLEIDALYARKGFRSTGATSTFDFSSAYLEIPLLLRLEFAPNRRLRPFIVAGPAFGAQIDCGGTTTSSSGTLDLNCAELEARSGIVVKKTDVSAVLGGGIGLPIGAVHLTLATRYTMGFLSVIGNNDNHNGALSFYVGLGRARRD